MKARTKKQLTEQLEYSKSLIKNYTKRIYGLKKNIREKRLVCCANFQTINDLRSMLINRDYEIKSLRSVILTQESDLDKLKSIIEDKNNSMFQLSKEISGVKNHEYFLVNKVDEINKECGQKMAELTILTGKCLELKELNEKLETTTYSLKNDNMRLQGKVEGLQQTIEFTVKQLSKDSSNGK